MANTPEYLKNYYIENHRSIKRTAKTNYWKRCGRHVYWIKPPQNYMDFCISNDLKPQLF